MANRLTPEEKQKITEAIQETEDRTSGELVAVIAESSDEYLYIPLLWASLIALSLPGIWYLFNYGWGEFSLRMYEVQVVVFAVLAILFRWTPIKHWLVPPSVKRHRASHLARQEFLTLGLHSTQNRAAILIFVSVAEHYVEILADQGINQKVPAGIWDDIVADFIHHVKQGQFSQGYLKAIDRCGKVLEEHFPPGTGDEDELPNHLIEL